MQLPCVNQARQSPGDFFLSLTTFNEESPPENKELCELLGVKFDHINIDNIKPEETKFEYDMKVENIQNDSDDDYDVNELPGNDDQEEEQLAEADSETDQSVNPVQLSFIKKIKEQKHGTEKKSEDILDPETGEVMRFRKGKYSVKGGKKSEVWKYFRIEGNKEKLICNMCGHLLKYAQRTSKMIYHLQQYHDLMKTQDFFCSQCGKDFKNKHSRDTHEKTHNSSLICPQPGCGKEFKTKSNFNTHTRIHTNIKPFPCKMCGKQFRTSTHLNTHLKGVHNFFSLYNCLKCNQSFETKGEEYNHRCNDNENQ